MRLPLASIRFQPDDDNVYTKMLLYFSHGEGEAESEILRNALGEGGVETELSLTPLHKQAPYSRCRRASMDFTDYRWRGAFSVPMRPNLTDADWKRIHKALAASRGELIGK